MKKFKFGVSIGFKPEEVNAILNPEFIKQLNIAETNRKNFRRLERSMIKFAKFARQQNTWLTKGMNKRTLKFTKHSMQIDKGFEIAKKWKNEYLILHPQKEEKE